MKTNPPNDNHPGIAPDVPPPPPEPDSNDDNDNYDPQPRQNKHDGEFVEALERIEPPNTRTHSLENNSTREGQPRSQEHRTQPRATEQQCTKRPTSQQQPNQTKRIRPDNGGKTPWSEPTALPAPFPLPPAELAQTSDTRLIRRLFRDTAQSTHKLFLVVAPPTQWESMEKANPT